MLITFYTCIKARKCYLLVFFPFFLPTWLRPLQKSCVIISPDIYSYERSVIFSLLYVGYIENLGEEEKMTNLEWPPVEKLSREVYDSLWVCFFTWRAEKHCVLWLNVGSVGTGIASWRHVHRALILGLRPGVRRDKIKSFLRWLMAILWFTQPYCLDLKDLINLSDSDISISIMQFFLICWISTLENWSSLSL